MKLHLVGILENVFFLLNNIILGYIMQLAFFFYFKYLNTRQKIHLLPIQNLTKKKKKILNNNKKILILKINKKKNPIIKVLHCELS
jgi:hypothetical protein